MTLVGRLICVLMLLSVSPQGLAQARTPEVQFAVSRFVVNGDNPLSAEQTTALLSQYTGEYSGLDGLLAAADELQRALAQHGH